MAAKKASKPAAPKPCPPAQHRMPDGTCMPDSEMPNRSRSRQPAKRTPLRRTTY